MVLCFLLIDLSQVRHDPEAETSRPSSIVICDRSGELEVIPKPLFNFGRAVFEVGDNLVYDRVTVCSTHWTSDVLLTVGVHPEQNNNARCVFFLEGINNRLAAIPIPELSTDRGFRFLPQQI